MGAPTISALPQPLLAQGALPPGSPQAQCFDLLSVRPPGMLADAGRQIVTNPWQSKLASLAHVLRVTGVHTVCRREVVAARRELGINLWIEPPNARASPCHLACAWCRLVPSMRTGLLGAPAGS